MSWCCQEYCASQDGNDCTCGVEKNRKEYESLKSRIVELQSTLEELDISRDSYKYEVARLNALCSELVAENSVLISNNNMLAARVNEGNKRQAQLTEALEQVLIDLGDPHPRTATLEGTRQALAATERMIVAVLKDEIKNE